MTKPEYLMVGLLFARSIFEPRGAAQRGTRTGELGRKFYRRRAAWGNFCDLGNDVPERFQARPFGDSLRPIGDEFDAGLVGPKRMTICDDPSHPGGAYHCILAKCI
jgi:hypothetical protein